MRDNFTKLFYDKQKLYIMVNLRINGWSSTSLAMIFGVDYSSIIHQCKKYNIVPVDTVYTIERIANEALREMSGMDLAETIASNVLYGYKPPKPEWELWKGRRYAIGKSYSEYLKEARYPHRRV